MKIPSPIQPSVQRSGEDLQGHRTPRGLDAKAQIGEAVAQFGTTLQAYGEKVKKQQRFKTLADFSDWKLETSRQLEELRRSTPEGDTTYYDRADSLIAQREEEFLAYVDRSIMPEMELEVRNTANVFRGSEIAFDSKRQDQYTIGTLQREGERRKLTVGRDAELLAANREAMHRLIDESGLPEAEKAAQKRQYDIELEKVGYATRVREEMANQDSMTGTIDSYVDKIFQTESGGDNKARSTTSSATGPAQFIESTWREFIEEEKPEILKTGVDIYELRTDPTLAREATIWYAEQNATKLAAAGIPVNEGTLKLAHFAGGAGAIAVYSAPPGTPIEEVLNQDAMNANDFLQGKTTGWLVDWAYKKMGREDAYSRVDDNPEYANLFYEDRIAIRSDVARRFAADQTAEQQAIENARRQRVDLLYQGLYDGQLGAQAIAEARERGDLTSYDEIKKANSILEGVQGDQAGTARIVNLLTQDNPPPMSDDLKDDRDALNAFAKTTGLTDAIDNMDPAAKPLLNQLADKLQAMPRDAIQKLNAGALSRDWNRSRYALDTLGSLYQSQPELMNKMTTDEELARVLTYESLKTVYGEEELRQAIQGYNDPALNKQRNELKSEALEWLAAKGYTADHIFSEMSSYFLFGEAQSEIPANIPSAFQQDFRAFFADMYARTGDYEKAWTSSMQLVAKTWGFHDDGDVNRFMRYPPEKFIPPLDGDYDTLQETIRVELGIGEDDTYELIADARTSNEALAYQRGQQAEVPSYQVVTTVDGVQTLVPQRYRPGYSPDAATKLTNRFRITELRKRRDALELEFLNLQSQSQWVPALNDETVYEDYRKRIAGMNQAIMELEAEELPEEGTE